MLVFKTKFDKFSLTQSIYLLNKMTFITENNFLRKIDKFLSLSKKFNERRMKLIK